MRSDFLTYLGAVAIGVLTVHLVMPLATVLGQGAGWAIPDPDVAQGLAGHLAFQGDGWRWPLLDTHMLFWPHGTSVALTDSNPLMSMLAKLWTRSTGDGPVNLLGVWIAACWLLQPVAGAYAARGFGAGRLGMLAAACLAACWPALLFRVWHVNLCAHFLILFALGIAARRMRAPGDWLWPAVVLVLAILSHPYIFQLVAAVLAAIPVQAALARRPGWRREAAWYFACCIGAVALLRIISGPLGGGDKGFVFFSMNLLSPFWPQRSGVFGPGLPILDPTGGQYEGFNWLGAGTWLLLLVAIGRALATSRLRWRSAVSGLAIVLAGLALLSLSSRVYAGPVKLIDLGTKPWEDIFGTFRTPGRAFWPVGYALMLVGVAAVCRLPRAIAAPLLLAAVVLQFIDAGPLRAQVHQLWAQGEAIDVPPVPTGTTLLGVAPQPGCNKDQDWKGRQQELLLHAARDGARLDDINMGRSPPWFACEKIASDELELPLEPGEVRAFAGPPTWQQLRLAALGPDAVCHRDDPFVICGRGVGPIAGTAVAAGFGPPIARLALPFNAAGPALAPLLATGWEPEPGAAPVWSEGPRNTLLALVPAGMDLEVHLHLAGVAQRAGGTREVQVSADRTPITRLQLPDGRAQDVDFVVPAAAVANGVLRLAFDTIRPVDPAKRGMTAPVQRAAIRLFSLQITAAK
jgi:hypothetical protein